MDTTWLSSWLTELNLSEYIGTFENAGYTTLELCATITDREELKNIGITKIGHLSRLFRAVEKLKSELNGGETEVLPPVGSTLRNSGQSDSQLDRFHAFQQSKSSSLDGEEDTRKPPPVPMRKSIRRATTSPTNLDQSLFSQLPSLAPPPVLPRQQSLKIRSSSDQKKPPVAARRGVHTIARGEESGLLHQTSEMLSPVNPLERNFPLATVASTTSETNGLALSTPPTEPLQLPPQPKPRPKPRIHSPDPAAVNKSVTDANEDKQRGAISNGSLSIAHQSDDRNVVNSLPEEPQEEEEEESVPPPPLPVKKMAVERRIIVPEEEVVFELEDVPMPETPQVTSSGVEVGRDEEPPTAMAPPLPPKDTETRSSSVSPVPALPPKEETVILPHCSTSPVPPLPPKDKDIPPASTMPLPALPPKENDLSPPGSLAPIVPPKDEPPCASIAPTVPLKEEEGVSPSTSPLPALPPRERVVTPPASPVPPLPPKEKEVPCVSPVPAIPPKQKDVTPSTSPLPPLPPKEKEIPPLSESLPAFSLVPDENTTPLLHSVTHTEELAYPDSDPLPPPPPVRRHFVTGNEDVDLQAPSKTPPLPRRDTGPPNFVPLPPSESDKEMELPPVPPPRTSTLSPAQRGVQVSNGAPLLYSPELTFISTDHLHGETQIDLIQETSGSHIQSYWNEDDDIIPISGLSSSGGAAQSTSFPAASDSEASEEDIPPMLPPKDQIREPPPPPPITPDDFPEDYSNSDMSDSDEERVGPLISIQSSRTVDDDRMMVAQVPSANGEMVHSDTEDGFTTASSAESTPKKKTLIRQSVPSLQRSFTDNDIMVVSPKPPAELDDYMNQEAIEKANELGFDYMNQDAIDQSLADEDDVHATNIEREHFVIRGSSPIRSRTLEASQRSRDTNKDYENQNVVDKVLEGDIIPIGTIPSPDEPPMSLPETYTTRPSISRPHMKRHKYEELDVKFEEKNAPHPVVRFDSKQLIFGAENSSAVPGPVASSSNDHELPMQEGVSSRHSEDDLEIESALETSGGSMNQTFPRCVSMSAAYHKPPLPRPQEPTTPIDADVKPRSYSVDDTIDGDANSSVAVPHGDGRFEPACLPRAAGTFAGVDSSHKRPVMCRFHSEDLLKRKDQTDGGRDLTESAVLYPGLTRKDSAELKNVPKTKEGFLYKKGGVHGDKPWQRRWVTFNGTELKYFKNQSDKDKSSRNIIQLAEMIDVKKVPDDDKTNRFDLVVINRVFQFYADSLDVCTEWISVLHAAISRFKPQEVKDGGNMSDPDGQGFLLKQGHGPFAKFKERYVALKGSKFAYYHTKEDFVQGRPIHILEMTLASVRPDMAAKLPRFLVTMNNQKQYVFQAADELERKEWMDMLTSAILTGLDTREQTLARTVKQTKSTEILKRIQENPSNKTCADCSATDPVWGVVNLGVMVCINCSGVHRSMGTHISKVRSVELDHQIWKDNLIELMNAIGNERSNSFWERHLQEEKLPADVERDIRENFIRAKYEMKSWIPRPTGESRETLNKLLCVAVKTDNLLRTVELLTQRADVCHAIDDPNEPDVTCVLDIAKKHHQRLQVELLEQNGALVCRSPQEAPSVPISKKGFLYKTGSDRAGWKKRYCSLDKYRGFQYYKSETDTDMLGNIHMEEMMSVAKCDDELSRDPKYQHCFEVNTQGRGYLFCAESEAEMEEWIKVFEQIIKASDAAENLGYDKVGYLKKRDPHNVGGWKRRWFTLKGKSLAYYKREREEVDEIDLRKVTDLKGPDPSGTYEQQCSIQIVVLDKTYHLKAENPAEAESWMSALRHTQVSGIPLSEQQLTSTGIPILIHKCLQFVESYGMETEGLYRLSGEKSKIRKLILAFNQDARGVVIDPDTFTVHDVTGTLKLFFRSLPDPLLTHQLYQSFIAAMQTDHESLLYQLQSLIEQLPLVNKDTLKRMIGHLRKVADYEAKNKMGVSNLVSLFGPTMMTVDGDPITFANTKYECNCISTMIKFYKWLFQVDEEEEKKEEAIEKGLQKIREAELMQQRIASISSNLGFLTTIYIGSKEGDSFNTNITGQSTVAEVVEDVATRKALPKDNYALYLVLGDSESHRVLSFSEKLLAAQCSAGTDCFLCLKPNAFADTLSQYFDALGEGMPVTVHVREKKKWRKYPCTVRNSHFIQFKDVKCHNEFFKVPVSDIDIFAGIERKRIDVKNPMPTRYCFWLKTMRGEENCKYLCADSEADMLTLMAAIVQAKYTDRLRTPLLPVKPPPETLSPPLGMDRRPTPEEERKEFATYSNFKLSGRTR